MRVYTFTLPKFVSGIVRKCMFVFRKDEQPNTSNKKKKKKNEKTPG